MWTSATLIGLGNCSAVQRIARLVVQLQDSLHNAFLCIWQNLIMTEAKNFEVDLDDHFLIDH